MAPEWVLDAVIVHELAHLIEPNHSARFVELERRYPRRREADMFLEGYALGLHMPDSPPGGPGGDRPDEPDGGAIGHGTDHPVDATALH